MIYKDRKKEIAMLFSAILKSWLTDDEFSEMVELTKTQTDPMICHSGDYCDSNMAMHGALVQLRIITEEDSVGESEDLTNLWNDSWDLAKGNLFYTSK